MALASIYNRLLVDDTTDGEDGDLSTPPRARGDSLDEVLKRAVAAPASIPTLPAGTTVGRHYVVERVLGSGGMGTVYLARDRSLDRAVALKLHRTVAASDRLHREAIAMAKLAHPNVVTVFEVGELDGKPFVAMEYVAGATLRAWLGTAERTWGATLAALVAAGEGLAAAHDAGLVHRDVKPDNILVGDDGRVRIGDFGLALLPDGQDKEPLASGSPGNLPAVAVSTATGTVLGTPAYMAPEQMEGRPIDARTDQFAFCVAAWEALCGDRPFGGTTAEELRDAIVRGELAPPRRGTPARIRRVLSRGMASDPAARYPSMRALLAALRSAERRPRVLAAAGAGALVAGAAVAYALWPARDPAAACELAGSDIDALLPPSFAAAATMAARRGGGANAEEEARRILERVGEYRSTYRTTAQTSCRAAARGQWSPDLARASNECAAYLARTARELLVAAPAAATQPSDVLQIVDRMPDLAPCRDPRQLAAWRPLAEKPAELEGVIAARARLEAASVLLEFAQVPAARAARDAVAATPVHADPNVARRLDLVRGEIAVAEGKLADAEPVLADVYYASRAQDDGPVALAAATDLIDLTGRVRRDRAAAERWIRDGLADAERQQSLQPRPAFALEMAAGGVYVDEDAPERALELAKRAEALHVEGDAAKARLLRLRADAYASLGKPAEATAAIEGAVTTLRHLLGPKHPKVADALAHEAAILLEVGPLDRAATFAKEAAAILAGVGSDVSALVGNTEWNLGATLLQIQDKAAGEHLERARKLLVAIYGEDHADIALLDTNLALVYRDRGDSERALATLRHATAVQTRILGPDHDEVASGLYNLAVLERQTKHLDDAAATARRCAAIFEKHQPGSLRHLIAETQVALVENERHRWPDALAATAIALASPHLEDDPGTAGWVRLETAKALIGGRTDPARARKLLGEARERYTKSKDTARIAEVDALLAGLR
jgi:eukaryotic-like serine/threonine-protein kinase